MGTAAADISSAKIYVDGIEEVYGSTMSTDLPAAPSGKAFIGSSTFNGTIDEVQIWNHALSEEEINASYNTGVYRLYHNFTNLTEGTYTYTAYAQDLAGNVNQTETRTITLSSDTTSPTLILQTPAQNGTYYNYIPYLNGTCTDTSGISKVWTNFSQYNTTTTSPFNLTNTSVLSSQRYDVNLTCNDTYGNIASKIFYFTYDPVQPNIIFVSPTKDNNTYTNNNYTYINVSISDSLSGTNLTSFIDWNRSLVGWWRFNGETGENTTFFRDCPVTRIMAVVPIRLALHLQPGISGMRCSLTV